MIFAAHDAIIRIDLTEVNLTATTIGIIMASITGFLGTMYKLTLGFFQSRQALVDAMVARYEARLAELDKIIAAQTERIFQVASDSIKSDAAQTQAVNALAAKIHAGK